MEKTFRPTEKFPQARIDRKDMQYLYSDGDLFTFMDMETYDQVALNSETVGDALKFVKENEVCKICSTNGGVFAVEPPLFVELEITETEPGFKGDTATGAIQACYSGNRSCCICTSVRKPGGQDQDRHQNRRISVQSIISNGMLFYYLAYKTMEFLHGRVFIVFFISWKMRPAAERKPRPKCLMNQILSDRKACLKVKS